MDDPDEPGFTEPPRGIVSGTDPRRLYAVIAVLLVVIVVLAIRPWGDDSGDTVRGDAVTPSVGQPAAATRGPDASILAEATPGDVAAGLDETCGSPSGWRAATLQQWAGRSTPIRSWIAIEPVTASGAADPGVPFAPVATGIVTAIGYCAPLGDEDRPPAVAVASLWAVRDGQPMPLSLRPLEPSSPDALGGLWQRPPEVADAPGASPGSTHADVWPPGRYVVELASPGGEYDRWLGIEIADLSLLRSTPSPVAPAASPSASASATDVASPSAVASPAP